MKQTLAILVASVLAAAGLTLAGPAANADYPGTVATTCSGVAKEIKRAGRNTVRVTARVTAGNATPVGTLKIRVAKKAAKSGAAPVFRAKFAKVARGKQRVIVKYAPAAGSPFMACSFRTTLRVHR
jgi:hypothetical protein